MKLHRLPTSVTTEELDKIPTTDSLAFDLTTVKEVIGETRALNETNTSALELKNPNLAWFYGSHNRYFKLNNKSYWFAAIQVNAIYYNPVTGESTVYLEGKFVAEEKSLSFILNRDMSGNYYNSEVIDTIAKG